MVFVVNAKKGIGAEILAFDAFLDGIPEVCVDSSNSSSVFDSIVIDKEEGTALPMLERFLEWETRIEAQYLVVGLEGEMHVPHVVRFVEMLLTKTNAKLIATSVDWVDSLRELAAEVGSLPIFKSACEISERLNVCVFFKCMNIVITAGHVHVLEWFITTYWKQFQFKHDVGYDFLRVAIFVKQENVVRFIVESGNEHIQMTDTDLASITTDLTKDGTLGMFQCISDKWDTASHDFQTRCYRTLNRAFYYHNHDIAEYILATGRIRPHLEGVTLRGLMRLAISFDDTKMLRILVDAVPATRQQFFPTISNSEYEEYIDNNSLPMVKFIISEAVTTVHRLQKFQRKVLSAAAKKPNLDIIKYLLDEQEPPERRPSIHFNNSVLLRLAATRGYLHVVMYLLDKRDGEHAHINPILPPSITSPLVTAVYNHHMHIVVYLLDTRDGEKATIPPIIRQFLPCLRKDGHTELADYLSAKIQ